MGPLHATQLIRSGKTLSRRDQIILVMELSFPAIMARISSIVMQYVDASMVGCLGASASASIGLVASTTWLFSGVCASAAVGFSVLVAQRIGAREDGKARNIEKEGILLSLGFSFLLLFLGSAVSAGLPRLLGGSEEIALDASRYFLITVLALPFMQLNNVCSGMLQSSGDMKVPSILNILMCFLNVIFNALFIFPTSTHTVLGISLVLPGAALGVTGAALGTALSQVVVSLLLLFFLLVRSPLLKLRRGERLRFSRFDIGRAVKIALPVGFEELVICGAMVASTRIISPLGTIALAANSFAITAEGLCYMPGHGIATAATTLVGQAFGAGRGNLARQFGWMSTAMGIVVMSVTGFLLHRFAPFMMEVLSPDADICRLGVEVLRIEAFAEPLYGASIVASGVLRGAGDTLIPSIMNFASMWCVRIPLALFLVPRLGLRGAWIAMCIELCARGVVFLIRQKREAWLRNAMPPGAEERGEAGL